jgi:hypothetical protein
VGIYFIVYCHGVLAEAGIGHFAGFCTVSGPECETVSRCIVDPDNSFVLFANRHGMSSEAGNSLLVGFFRVVGPDREMVAGRVIDPDNSSVLFQEKGVVWGVMEWHGGPFTKLGSGFLEVRLSI